MVVGTGYRQRDFQVGDMILYPYVEDETLRGRIINLMDEKCEIEVSFPGKKSDDLNCDNIIVYYSEIIPMSKGVKSFETKAQKKAKKDALKKNAKPDVTKED